MKSVNLKKDSKCIQMDSASQTMYGFKEKVIYAFNYVTLAEKKFENTNSDIMLLAARGDDIYSIDKTYELKKWSLSNPS